MGTFAHLRGTLVHWHGVGTADFVTVVRFVRWGMVGGRHVGCALTDDPRNGYNMYYSIRNSSQRTWGLKLNLGLRAWVSGPIWTANLDVPAATVNLMIISTVMSVEEG